MTPTRAWLSLSAALTLAVPAFAADPGPPTDKLNAKVAGLALPGPDGKPVPIAAGNKTGAAVVVFLSFDCPVSNSYAAPLSELAGLYADRGVKVFGVVP